MQRVIFIIFCSLCALALNLQPARAAGLVESKSRFYYQDSKRKVGSVRIIRHYWSKQINYPFATIDPRIDPKLRQAASLAEERATAHSKARCWHYVKEALVAAHAINSYPKTAYAADAGEELTRDYGFKRLPIRDPYKAPIGAVLVYGDKARGHVEIRTKDGFVSDYHSKSACFYPLRAVYAKFSS